MQIEPAASEIVAFNDARTYPTHLLADSLVFDHHCHLRHELGGRGPLDLDVMSAADIPGRAASPGQRHGDQRHHAGGQDQERPG